MGTQYPLPRFAVLRYDVKMTKEQVAHFFLFLGRIAWGPYFLIGLFSVIVHPPINYWPVYQRVVTCFIIFGYPVVFILSYLISPALIHKNDSAAGVYISMLPVSYFSIFVGLFWLGLGW